MSVTDSDALNMAVPQYPIDNIIAIFSGQFGVDAPTAVSSPKYAGEFNDTGFNDTCLTQCVFSTDDITYIDQDMQIPELGGAFPVFQTVNATAISRPNQAGVIANSWYDFVAGSGSAQTVYYKVLCIAKADQQFITPLPTDEILQYNSAQNYQKIFRQDSVAFSLGIGATDSLVVVHNLHYIPNVRAWLHYTVADEIVPASTQQYIDGAAYHNPVATTVQISDTAVTFDLVNAAGAIGFNLIYRIYLDS